MNWFTHFTRPARSGVAPGGRNHVRRSSDRTLCGVRLQAWMLNSVIVMDPTTGSGAYPDCKMCARLSNRHGLPATPVAA